MKTKFYLLILLIMTTLSACKQKENDSFKISENAVSEVIASIETADTQTLEKGVRQVAKLWRADDGTESDFKEFCKTNYIPDPEQKKAAFDRICFYLEGIRGHFNQMVMRQRWNTDLDTGTLLPIDEAFAAYSPAAHLSDDLYDNKIAFVIALNFPETTLAEKENLGSDRLAWAYARMGDMFTERIPAEIIQNAARAESEADVYVAGYNIYMGHLLTENGQHIFPEDMVLLSHWNLRDEIKSNYNMGDTGLEKQRMIYRVMERIISQEIPAAVINSPDYEWNPYTNAVTQNGNQIDIPAEATVRYQRILDNFHAMREIDRYTGNTYIDRKFDQEMEVGVDAAEKLFDNFLSSPELQTLGKLIAEKLGRNLEPYDIWYDGFKPRSNLDENKLSEQTYKLYPGADEFEKAIPSILVKLGWAPQRAQYLSDKIAVDAARGSGHAWGAEMKGQKSHLRTRLTNRGMDYKGYNIAMHELGHNVEQTISMYDVDYYMMNGVPNTAFTEALAFIFQKRDLEVLGIRNNDPQAVALDVMDKAWSLYEICGVSMLDIAVWKWLYANPDATDEQLRDQVVALAKEVWNKYYAPVFGRQDETVLAIYSHMVGTPLYLSAYAFGQMIEFQLERHFEGKDFAPEVDRIFKLGRLTPGQWMLQATGNPLSTEPMLVALRKALE